MIEALLIQYFESIRFSAPVYVEAPKDTSLPYVLIDKTGGGEIGRKVYSSTVALQCCAETMYAAAMLADSARDAMYGFEDLDEVCGLSLNSGPYNFTNPAAKLYRYQIVYNIIHY